MKKIFDIQSKDNPKIKTLKGLLEHAQMRKKLQKTVLEGAHLLESYLHSPLKHHIPEAIFTTEIGLTHPENQSVLTACQSPIYILPEQLFQNISQLGQSSALMSVIDIPQHQSTWHDNMDTLILDAVQDAGNVGTLLRSAAAVGIRQILTTSGTAKLWSPKVLRAAMGAHFSLNLYENIDEHHIIERFNINLFATSSHHAKVLYQVDLKQPCAWVLGNEGQGVKPLFLQHAQAICIPQPGGQESLNVAVAGSICLFEMMRQRSYT